MPIYSFECPSEHQFDAYVHTRETVPSCPLCGSEAPTKIWTITKRSGYNRYPYTTKHITGQELTITDASHEARILKEHGMVQRDDVAYIDKEYAGFDWRTGQQRYREGSGRGLPGQWV